MTDMVFLTDGDYHHGTKCPETKLEIKERKMTETDISKVLIEGEYATIMGVKYKRVEEPKTIRAEQIVNATMELTLRPQQGDRAKVIAVALREVVKQLQKYGTIDVIEIGQLCDELEAL
jgi:hypothetical protein